MKKETSYFEQPKNIESTSEKQELTPEQKITLGESWTKMAVDNASVPEDVSKMDNKNLKKWLFESTMKDIGCLADEWGLKADNDLIEKIQKTEDLNEKSTLELDYIGNAHAQVSKIVQNFDRSGRKSTKWDSWPKRMRETKEFNCVGATLLGINFLEKGAIKSYYGNPAGHVLNIARLSNGDWWYVDFRNGKNSVIKIEPEETSLVDTPVLKINHPSIDYKLIPLYDKSEAPCSILSNLASLKRKIKYKNIPDKNIERKEEREYLQRYDDNFKKADFSTFHQSLYPKFIEVEDMKEMQREIVRIETLRDFEKPVQDYLGVLTKKQEETLTEKIKTKKKDIEDLFYKDDKSILHQASLELKKALNLYLENLRAVKDKQPEIYQEAIDKIVGRIRNL